MTEYWVNVYQTYHYRNNYGRKLASRLECDIIATRGIKYRLHVKLKDKPGLSRNYHCTFDQLLKFPYLKAFMPHVHMVTE